MSRMLLMFKISLRVMHSYRVPADSLGNVNVAYEVSVVPTTYVIDAEGKVEVAVVGGPASWETIQNELRRLEEVSL